MMGQKYARRCWLLALAKVGIALAAVALTEFVPLLSWMKTDSTSGAALGIWVAVGAMALGVMFFGVTLIPFYQKYLVKDKRRRVTRRFIGAALSTDGLSILISEIWPTYFDLLLSLASLGLGALFLIAMMYDYGHNDPPRRKRRRFKAKWPAWIKKRWSVARSLPKPRPRPAPGRA